MDYKSGNIYLDGRKRELIAYAVCTVISRIAKLRDELSDLGLGTRGLDWDIQNYQAILKVLSEEE